MKAATATIFILGFVRIAVSAVMRVRLIVKQPSWSKRAPEDRLEVFATRRLAFLKQHGDAFRLHRPGITGAPGTVSLESARLPGFFLKQQGYKFHIDGDDEDDDFKPYGKLSTFIQRERPDVPDVDYFELSDRPGWFICHENRPKLILRAREISRTPDFIDRCAFFVESFPEEGEVQTNYTTTNQHLAPKPRPQQSQRKLPTSRPRTKFSKPRTTPKHTPRVPKISEKTVIRVYKVHPQTVAPKLKIKAPLLKKEKKHVNKTIVKKINTPRIKATTPVRMLAMTKQPAKDVGGTKKESGVGLPIVFSREGANRRNHAGASNNETSTPIAEVVDPAATARDSDSMLALHTDRIIQELEQGEFENRQLPTKSMKQADQIDNLIDNIIISHGHQEPTVSLQQASHYENAATPPVASNLDDDTMHLIRDQHQIHLIGRQDEEERQRLMSHLVNYKKDKCLSIVFLNKIGNRYRLLSSFNPHGYRPKGVEFSLKAIFKDYGKRSKVAFHAVDAYDENRQVLLNGQADLLVSPEECLGQTQLVEVTSPFVSHRMVLDDNLAHTYCPSITPHVMHDSKGHCCAFPFLYKGIKYKSCIAFDSDWPWCSLTHSFDKDKLWGYCAVPLARKRTSSPILCPLHCFRRCTRRCPLKCCIGRVTRTWHHHYHPNYHHHPNHRLLLGYR